MTLDHLWAGWRTAYINGINSGSPPPSGEGTLFERIMALPDEVGYVVARSATCAVLLNAYPYNNGHVMVLPRRAVENLDGLTGQEHDELWALVRDATVALRAAYRCDGINVGANLGRAGGAGLPEHLHIHVLPRWEGDTNFMTSVANTRVLPETLAQTWEKLRAAWPA